MLLSIGMSRSFDIDTSQSSVGFRKLRNEGRIGEILSQDWSVGSSRWCRRGEADEVRHLRGRLIGGRPLQLRRQQDPGCGEFHADYAEPSPQGGGGLLDSVRQDVQPSHSRAASSAQ